MNWLDYPKMTELEKWRRMVKRLKTSIRFLCLTIGGDWSRVGWCIGLWTADNKGHYLVLLENDP